MNWREAFFQQAQSDYRVLCKMEDDGEIEESHRLHYLQMMTEKLAKGYFADLSPDSPPPKATHAALVNLLQMLKQLSHVRRRLGMEDAHRFTAYIDSLLPLAGQIQSLAPAIAGTQAPNPEYPWYDKASKSVLTPCQYPFTQFSTCSRQMMRLTALIRQLLLIGSDI